MKLFLILFLFVGKTFSQQIFSDEKIISASLTGQNKMSDIDVDNNGNIFICWINNLSNHKNIFFSKSTDLGNTFSLPIQTNDVPNYVNHIPYGGPKIDERNGIIHIIWADERLGYTRTNIFYSRSTDSGLTWSTSRPLGLASKFNAYPEIKIDDSGIIHIIYYSYNRIGLEFENIHYVSSNDGGITFSSPVVGSNFIGSKPCDCCPADIHFLNNGKKIIAFRNDENNIRDMYFVSADSNNWGNLTRISNDNYNINFCPSSGPTIASKDSLIAISYMVGKNDVFKAFLKISNNNLNSFGDSIPLDPNAQNDIEQNHPSVGIDNDFTTHIIWEDERGLGDIYYGKLLFGNNFVSDIQSIIEDTTFSYQGEPRLFVQNNDGHIVWTDTRNESHIYYRKWKTIPNSVDEELETGKRKFNLNNFPNPFNPKTKILFSLNNTENVSLKIYDVFGREIKTLIDKKFMSDGNYKIDFDGSNFNSGIYFYKLTTNNFSEMKKMVLVK